ncbi:MAG: GH36 C-terminal domain-containing protein [Bacteroidales bacterium]|nr:GH36 C-terminal domain-containing protein [Bacteroidales bacterium]
MQFGDLYRLVSPYENSRSVVSYVEADKKGKAAVFIYQIKDDNSGITVKLQGLDPEKTYVLEEVNIDSPEAAKCKQNGQSLSGAELMNTGIYFDCTKRLDSASVYLSER